ncbi:MAG: hypothetical protein UHD09_06265 [Bifidobacterium sp.]|nr:hypothetical protein [Bifidobacterium sp.]
MKIDLFKTLEAPSYYGDLPDFQPDDTEHVISAYFYGKRAYDFDLELTESLNDSTDGILSLADVDFYDADTCRELIDWIDTHQDDIN